jgi:hypothetical protein
MVSNVELYRIRQRRKIALLKLKLIYDYRCDLSREMRVIRYGKWSKKSLRQDELERRDLDDYGPFDS